jgi:hypothetical protein
MALAALVMMSMRDIPMSEWRPFLERLGREHRAWLATIERGDLIQAREEPLQSISAANGIEIRIGEQVVRVDEPRALRVEETGEGAPQTLEIDDAAGARVRLRFRVAVAPGALDGLAPGER